MRGAVSGAFWGVVVGGVGLVTASLVSEQPAGTASLETPLLNAPDVASDDSAPLDSVTSVEPTEETAYDADASRVAAPSDEVAQVPEADVEPSPLPDTGDVDAVLTAPEDVDAPQISAGLDEPVLSNDHTGGPTVPAAEQEPALATQPAAPVEAEADQPVVANVAEPAAAPVPEASEAASTAQTEAPEPITPAQDVEVALADVAAPEDTVPTAVASEPELTTDEAAPNDETIAEASTEAAPAPTAEAVPPVAAPVPDVVEAPAVQPAPAEPAPATQSAPAPSQVAQAVTQPRVVPDEPAPPAADASTISPSRGGAVRVNRLGQQPEPEVAEPTPDAETETAISADASALFRYAATYNVPANVPLISVVVVDNGALSDPIGAISGLPFPVTVILDASQQNANAQMRSYRDAGIEVGMKTFLPFGAKPEDVEVAFEAAFAAVPEAVVLLDEGDSGLQRDRALTAQAMQVLSADGRGLVAFERGLGSAVRAANQANVPAGSIFKDLDGDQQDARAILRGLDQAAFRARQSSGVVLLARLEPATLAALSEWGNKNDDQTLAIAPISALLGEQ